MSDLVSYEVRDRVAIARIDNGKANALSPTVLQELGAALDRAEDAGDAVGALLITGKPGFLSGGFDLEVMRSTPAAALGLSTDGGELFTRFYASSMPVIVGCPGHAVAAGALMLLSADERIGAEGSFRIGLNETQIGMSLPRWAVELADDRLSRRHLQMATLGARLYDPAGARDAGYLDELVAPDAVLTRALEAAAVWAALPRDAYRRQVRAVRGERIAALEAAVAEDRATVSTLTA